MMFETDALPIPDEIADHGQTAQLVYVALELAERGLSTDELADALKRPIHTVRSVTHQLAEDGLIDRRPDPHDSRCYVYKVD